MKEQDARRLSIEQQEELRRRVAQMVVKQGMTVTGAAKLMGVSRRNASRWVKLYRKGGAKALRQGRRGRRMGSKRRLTLRQERVVQRMIVNKVPTQLQFPYALWTRQAIIDAVQQRYGIRLPVRTMGEYLKRWKFTPQRPLRRAYERDPQRVAAWLKKEYPRIRAQAKAEKAEILWADETGISTDDHRGRGYAPQGQTPVVEHPGYRTSASMISAISNRGLVRFMIYRGGMTSGTFVKFLQRLLTNASAKIFLIVDNLTAHHSRTVTAWVENNRTKIQLFFLPPYAPELNPTEYLNNDLKQSIRSKPVPGSFRQLASSARKRLRKLQATPTHVQKFFHHPAVAYAA